MKTNVGQVVLVLLLGVGLMSVSRPGMSTPVSAPARAVEAVVSTQWLEENIDSEGLVILDVREAILYEAGHIPGSISAPALGNFFLCIMDPDCGLWMELPPDDSLFATIGKAGIAPDSRVVIIPRAVDSPSLGPAAFGLTMGARVAITLIYAGVQNVAMLDGGYTKWVAEKRATSTEPVVPTPVVYSAAVDKNTFVTKEYVEARLGNSTLLDTREADTYFGVKRDPSSQRLGHIPTSKVLPAPWFWETTAPDTGATSCLTWKDASAISEIARTVLGEDGDEEIIVYCGVGGYASPVYYLLSEVVGYRNLKFYDGSMQEWTADPDAPVTRYRYE
jgi:thiosulfate/3-mercaptopyruvate sulfurtransferase